MEFKKKAVRNSILGVSLAIGGLTLASCNEAPTAHLTPNQPATVTGHEYTPAGNDAYYVGGFDNPPIMITHPESFALDLQQCGHAGERNTDNNGCVTEVLGVDHEMYDHYPDGSTIVVPKQQ